MLKINIAVAEDNIFLLQALKEKLSFFEDLSIKITAENGLELIEKIEKNHNIDIVLMDIQMPVMNGIQAVEIIKNRFPKIKIIMLTVLDDDDCIFKSIMNGADGYLLKETKAEELFKGICDIKEGGSIMTPSVAMRTLKMFRNPDRMKQSENSEDYDITKRETEILEALSKGLDYKQIAEIYFISSGTVRKHVENIYRKLQVHNKIEAVQKAMKSGII